MSKAVVFSEYGPPEVLQLIDVPLPEPGPGQVRISMRAAAIQPYDNMFRSGAIAARKPANFPQPLGNEVAGVVAQVGADVTKWTVGEAVLGWVATGAFAEAVLAGADHLVAKPADMPWVEAGALSGSGQTAHTTLEDLAVQSGETLLIHAAAGGVGSIAVQLGVARGATVIGTASEPHHEYLRSIGAQPVSYGDGLVERVRALAPTGVDAVLDAIATEESLRASLVVARDRNRIGAVAASPLVSELGIRALTTRRSLDRLSDLVWLCEAGQLRVSIQRAYPLIEAAAAHREVATGHVRGKVVLTAD